MVGTSVAFRRHVKCRKFVGWTTSGGSVSTALPGPPEIGPINRRGKHFNVVFLFCRLSLRALKRQKIDRPSNNFVTDYYTPMNSDR